MKKLALSLAVLFGVAMVSCGGNEKKECADSCADTCVEAAEVAVVEDTTAQDTAVVAAEGVAAEEVAAPTEEPKEDK